MNYAGISDAEINIKVAKLIFPASEMNTPYYHRPDVYIYHRNGTSENKDYCNSWTDAGPVIEDYQISLDAIYEGGPRWLSFAGDDGQFRHVCPNPLRAAMIVFLMMQENKDE